jgi:glycyl-tRNA synthetase beta chain
MPHLLLEILSEEIPARMQLRAEADLRKLLLEALAEAGLKPEAVRTFSTPRRLGMAAEGLPAAADDMEEERKGPRVGAPDQAIQGFLKAAGLQRLDQAEIVADKKGDYYLARIRRKGRATPEALAAIVPAVIRAFPWPKAMRSQSSDLQWVRPIRNILLTFDGEAIPVDIDGLPSVPQTVGHRFHAPGLIKVRRFEDYEQKLRAAHVMLDRAERKDTILADANTLCAARNLELVEDPGLLEEVAGLVEWPVALMGDMDPAFLDLPGEVIRLTMRTHQKYFAVRDPKSGALAPHFVTVANIESIDGGKAIAAGNARVLSARLNDARFFWAKDLESPLQTEERREKLRGLVYHAKLGSVWDKVERVAALARNLAPACGADPDLAEQAARLAKMDLVTETVGEFPELQGQVGRQLYEATEAKPDASIASAIEDHYRPIGPNDRVPTDPVAVTLALADKLDSLAAFWAIDEKPTGSGDPYALRRAALGVIRILLAGDVRISLDRVNDAHGLRLLVPHPDQGSEFEALLGSIVQGGVFGPDARKRIEALSGSAPSWLPLAQNHDPAISDSLRAFLHERLKVHLREQGVKHDVIDAVLAMPDSCDIVLVVRHAAALGAFLKTDDGKNLLAGYKRAANILGQEEKKEPGLASLLAKAQINENRLEEPAERALHLALGAAKRDADAAMLQERFADAMKVLASLRAPVDEMLEGVLVNAKDQELRVNRLRLLAEIRSSLNAVADFSKIEG